LSGEPLTHWHGEPVSVWRSLWDVPVVEAYDRIGSTNDRAKELAEEPGRAFAVVVAHEQTAGRGRRGARWHSPSGGGLWMSVVLPCPQAALHLPLLVGLAAAEAIEEGSAAVRVGMEWPNDLVVRGRKVGGILCEGVPRAVVAGLGINVRTPDGGFPEALRTRATSLEEEGGNMLQTSVLAGLVVRALKARVTPPWDGLAPDALAALGGRDALLTRPVESEEHGVGRARGIGPDGALLLERPDGSRVRVVAGSVRPHSTAAW
jgi:BirA family biotin operon repressor/biotin-[acetyl-CoA-carboxylase] ligase